MMDFRSRSGASMVIALVIMILFLSVGTSVLVAATASMSGSESLMQDKRLYYFASSVAETVTSSLEGNGELGQYLVKAFNEKSDEIKAAESGEQLEFECTLSATGMPAEFMSVDRPDALDMEPLSINFDPADVVYGQDGRLAAIAKLTIGYAVNHGEQTYRMKGDYSYEEVEPETGEAGDLQEETEKTAGKWKLIGYYTEGTP